MACPCGCHNEREHKENGHKLDGHHPFEESQARLDARDCDLCNATRAAISAGLRPKWCYRIGEDGKRHQHVLMQTHQAVSA